MIIDELRVREWIHVLGLPVLGYIFATRQALPLQLSLLMVVSVCSLIFAYTLGMKPGRYAFLSFLAAVSFICSYLISPNALLVTIAGYALVVSYALPPLRLKGVPLLGTVLNGAGFGLLVLLGSMAGGPPAFKFSAFCGLAVIPLQLIHEIAHEKEDRKTRHNTTAVSLGPSQSRAASCIFLAILAAASYLAYGLWLLVPTAVFSVAVALSLAYFKDPSKARLASRILSIFFGLAILAILLSGSAFLTA